MDNPKDEKDLKDNTGGNGEIKDEWRAKAEEYLNNWKRARADMINYRKEEAKRMEDFLKFANEGLILDMLDIVDSLDISIREAPENVKDGCKNWFMGLEKTKKQVSDIFKKYGVERVPAKQEFDPNIHEITEGHIPENAKKVEEIRAGYTMYGKVIRPARVKFVNN
ncbi:MAG: molecular chaperone GrpE [Parcubacteria group bacterium Licking1014_17]|nr:MAG: molecular chaperone GrpE [Parcubacteria group bacterium Licking1014_17]